MRSSDWSSDVCSADLQSEHRAGVPHRCLADFVAPASSGLHDYVGAFAVTTGIGAAERIAAFRKANDDYSAIILEALADRLAEARSEEHTSELQSLMRISYAVFCLKKKKQPTQQ